MNTGFLRYLYSIAYELILDMYISTLFYKCIMIIILKELLKWLMQWPEDKLSPFGDLTPQSEMCGYHLWKDFQHVFDLKLKQQLEVG